MVLPARRKNLTKTATMSGADLLTDQGMAARLTDLNNDGQENENVV